jgi:hypothetical protein
MDALVDGALGPRELIAMLLGVLDEYTGQDAMSTAFLDTHLAATRDPGLPADVAVIVTGFRDRMAGWLRRAPRGRPGDGGPRAALGYLTALAVHLAGE